CGLITSIKTGVILRQRCEPPSFLWERIRIILFYTTGLGNRSPRHPLIVDQRILGVAPPPGITLYGPLDLSKPNYKNYWFVKRMLRGHIFPEAAAWPTTEVYVDVHLNVAMTEFTVFQTMGPAAYVWGYLSAQK
ncbi:MAG: hypothetical protein AAGE59_10050, partial [Cyanobacteria bacterium P01_F01_bin.86]